MVLKYIIALWTICIYAISFKFLESIRIYSKIGEKNLVSIHSVLHFLLISETFRVKWQKATLSFALPDGGKI